LPWSEVEVCGGDARIAACPGAGGKAAGWSVGIVRPGVVVVTFVGQPAAVWIVVPRCGGGTSNALTGQVIELLPRGHCFESAGVSQDR